MADADWYCRMSGETSGPFSIEEIRFLLDRGRLLADHEVRLGKNGTWKPASTVAEFFPPSPVSQPSAVEHAATPTPDRTGEERPDADGGAPAQGSPTPRVAPVSRPPPALAPPVRFALAGAGIGTGLVLLVVVFALMILRIFGGGRGPVAELAGGAPTEEVVTEEIVEETGGGQGDGEDGTVPGPAASGEDTNGEEVRFEGEVPDEEADPPPPDAKAPELDIPPPDDVFTVERLQESRPEKAATGGAGGGGGGLRDFRERLEREGGQSGEVQVSLIWNNINDLDLYVICPSGEEIYYQHSKSRCGGELDVDMNAGAHRSTEPVENVYWPEGQAPSGEYRVMVNHYRRHGARDPTEFQIAVRYGGSTKKFSSRISYGQPRKLIHTFSLR